MTRTRTAVRLLAAFVAALALIGFSAAGSQAQSAGEAIITIHKASCPEGTGANIFEKCHGNALAGIGFDIDGEDVTTGSNGHATTTVDAGTVTITEDPSDFADYVGARVFCSMQGSQEVLIDASAPTGSVNIKAAGGDDIVCDWYNLTGSAATSAPTVAPTVDPTSAPDEDVLVTIHKATCPAGTGTDIFDKCHDNGLAGIGFDISGDDVTTDANGHAGAVVDPGTVWITEDPSDFADYDGARVFCSEQGSQHVLYDSSAANGSISFTAAAGDDVVCDWYNLTAGVVQTPTTGPTASATTAPSATKTPTITLPNTGAGDTGGSSNGMLLIAGALLTVIGSAFVLRKKQLN